MRESLITPYMGLVTLGTPPVLTIQPAPVYSTLEPDSDGSSLPAYLTLETGSLSSVSKCNINNYFVQNQLLVSICDINLLLMYITVVLPTSWY